MGNSKGGGQTVGYKYYLGLHLVACQAPIDFVCALKFQDKVAWRGFAIDDQLSVDRPDLFGGEGSEGGVSGTFDVLSGKPTQGVNDYLAAQAPPAGFASAIKSWLASNFPIFSAARSASSFGVVPAFRGAVSVVARRPYIGNNPYLKPIRIKARNILSTFGRWHPEIAPINPEVSLEAAAFYIAIDTSAQMIGDRIITAKAAVADYLERLKGSTCSVHLVAFSAQIDSSIEITDCSDADYDTLIAWVNALQVSGPGADFAAALGEASTFFGLATAPATDLATVISGSKFFQLLAGDSSVPTSVNKCVFFVTAGAPDPASSAADAAALIAADLPGVSVFGFNAVNDDTSYTAQLDSTDWDGVPVIGEEFKRYFKYTPTPLVAGVSPDYASVNLEAALNLTGAEIDALAAAGAQVVFSQGIYGELTDIAGGGPAGGTLQGNVNAYDGNGQKIYAPEGSAAMGDSDSFTGAGSISVQFTLPVGARVLSFGAAFAFTLPLVTNLTIQPGLLQVKGKAALADNSLTAIPGSLSSWVDINPAHMMRDLLLNPVCGGSGDPSAIGDSFLAAAYTLYNEGFGLSLANASPSSRDDFKQEIERHIDAETYFDEITGKWEIKLIRADYTVGNLPVFDQSNIEEWADMPSRPRQHELPNQITVVYTSREDGSQLSYTVTNTAAVAQVGVIIPEKREYPGITVESLARDVAGRDLATRTVPLTTGAIRVSWVPVGTNIGSPVIINDPRVGIVNMVCRVTEMDEGDALDNSVVLRFVEDTYGRQVSDLTSALATVAAPDKSAQPPTAQLVWEQPYWALVMQSDQDAVDARLASDPDMGYMFAATDRPSQYHVNAEIARLDGTSWVGTGAAAFAPYATLSASLSAAADATSFDIPFDDDLTQLAAGDLLVIDDEVMRVDDMALSGSVVTVTVGRGVLDTVPAFHAAGAAVLFWWQFGGSDGVQYTAGESVTYRLLPRTSDQMLSLDRVGDAVVTFDSRAQRPYPVGNLQVGGSYLPAGILTGAQTLTWAHRDRTLQTTVTPLDFTAASIGPEAGDTYYSVRRTVEERADLFALSDLFGVSELFTAARGTEVETALAPAQALTVDLSADDIDLFSFADCFGQADAFAGAFLPSTLRLELGIRTKNGIYTNWQTPVVMIAPLLPASNLTASEL